MSKEHDSAYEAGYRDGSINYELEHCPACKNVADLQEVLAENAKLLELVRLMRRHDRVPSVSELEAWHDEGDEIERRMSELGIEVES